MPPRAGDLLLVKGGSDLQSRIIRAGTKSTWTHVAIFMNADGTLLAEATHSGIAFADVAKYAEKQTHIVGVGLSDEQRVAACRFAASQVGNRYSGLEIASIVAAWATHGHIFVGSDKRETCASLCARCLEHGGIVLGKPPALFSPGDLSAMFNVTPRLAPV